MVKHKLEVNNFGSLGDWWDDLKFTFAYFPFSFLFASMKSLLLRAFDRADHEFLMCALSKFGFGPVFCGWVSLFYNNVFSHIICIGKLTCPIS